MADYTIDTLIVGASFYGCGLASRLGNALVVESSTAVGSDYAYTFEQGVNWNVPAQNPLAEEFRQQLFRRKAVDDAGRLLNGALVPVFADWCVKHNVRPLLGMELVCKQNNRAEFVDFCGKKITVEAKNIIDARPHYSGTKNLTAAVYSVEPLRLGKHKFFNITDTIAKNIYYLSFEVEADSTFQSARQRLAALWRERPESLKNAQMVWSAVRFSKNIFDNPVAALDAGLNGKNAAREIADSVWGPELEFDVVVCGLGTAGVTAAISASRNGAKVFAIDKTTYPGGVWTGGFIPAPYIQKNCGIAAELQEKAYALEGYFGQSENLKMRLEKSVNDARVVIRYSTVICSCTKENDRVTEIVCRDGNGVLFKVKAHSFIDATAEGILGNLAGAEMTCGRELDREFNSYTNTMSKFRAESFGAANFDAGRVAQYDVEDFSNCYLETCNVHLLDDYSVLHYCIQASDNPGLREGRHIVPEKSWNLEKYFQSGGKCDDVIFKVISNLDTHAQDVFFESKEFQDWNIAASCWEIRITIPVPMQVLFPADVKGVIVPSRQLGVDHDLGCAVRMIPGLTAIGEVAGAIAAIAKEKDILPHEVKYSDIVPFIPEPGEIKTKDIVGKAVPDLNSAWTAASDKEIVEQLFSDDPALGIWNIKQQNKRSLALEVLAANSDAPAGYNAAFGLALLDDEKAIPVLRKLIELDDVEPVNKNLRFSAPRRIAAAYLLGRLHKAETADFLIQQLGKRDCEKFFAHVVCALIKIADANVEIREKTGNVLRELAEDVSWQMIEQLKGQGAAKRRSDGLLRWHIAKYLDKWQISHNIAEKVAPVQFDSHEKWFWKNYKSL